MEDISPTQARIYQIERYRQSVQAAAERTEEQPLRALYALLLQELDQTLEEFRELERQHAAPPSGVGV